MLPDSEDSTLELALALDAELVIGGFVCNATDGNESPLAGVANKRGLEGREAGGEGDSLT